MEDMAAIVLYGYESVEKKSPLDRYESEDVSSLDNSCFEYEPVVEEMKKMKIETKNKVEDTGVTFFDTTDACILELDPEKLKPTNKKQLLDLAPFLKYCRLRKLTIRTFSGPGIDARKLEGGGIIVYERSQLSDVKLERYSNKAREAIQQYNDVVTNPNSKLEFVWFTRCAFKFQNKLFITFKGRQDGNGQIGTYQAAILDKFCGYELQLVFLRHVEADKILAFLSLSGAAEEVKKFYRGNWN
ncbi:uncharacterized protein LOC141609486 [Silene latifolia]|uniref:uncharacterized protein LOC141609486 n=1 Tax=Silene latifolia TaxID=37657 RepID=UPI003D76C85C